MYIYHITSESEWAAAQKIDSYRPASFVQDGFIHCSEKDQVLKVANRIYLHQNGLVLLKIDPEIVPCPVIEENLEGGTELFPHIYGPLPVSAVVAYAPFICAEKGYTFPESL